VTYYLGIDGGGSKTTCIIGDEASILASATAGPSNVTRVGHDRARESLHRAIREACAKAKVDIGKIARSCIGVAGASNRQIAGSIRAMIAEVLAGEILVAGDMEIAMEAAFGAQPGVIVIAGTGSIAYGRDAQGRCARAGGWGFAISDEGSAHWVGREAVRRLLRAVEGGVDGVFGPEQVAEGSSLFREVKLVWNVGSVSELARNANASSDFAALFPAVVAADLNGDALAREVLDAAAEELARLAQIVVRQLCQKENSLAGPVSLAMAGGVFRHSARVRKSFGDQVRELGARIELKMELRPEVVDPVMGALQMARRIP
jgi:glucosamine kinase